MFFAQRTNLQLQINSSCLHHPCAVSPFFLPLLQFPRCHIASLRFPASTSPSRSSRFHYSVMRAYVNTHGNKYKKKSLSQRIPLSTSQRIKKPSVKKECCSTGGCKCAPMHKSNQPPHPPPPKSVMYEHGFIYLSYLFCYC